MSRENVELVQRMLEAFQANDFETALSSYDPDVEWDGTNLPDGQVGRGIDAIVETRFHDVLTIDGGLIVRIEEYTERSQALEAAGLRE
jgi:ketosteroid isomerase-like protein